MRDDAGDVGALCARVLLVRICTGDLPKAGEAYRGKGGEYGEDDWRRTAYCASLRLS